MDKKYEELSEELSDYWNTRIIKRTVKGKLCNGEEYEETYYKISEVYYYKDGKPAMWGESSINLIFQDREELESLLKQIKDARSRTVLEEKDNKLIDTNIKL